MTSMLAFLVAARRCEIHDLEQLARSCELVQAVSELVHHLQGERGASNLYLASGGVRFGPERAAEAAVRACSPASRSRCMRSTAWSNCVKRSRTGAAPRKRRRCASIA